jgi:radical SAM superfamily enzyme YgiQ (UPF0313 family)
MKILLFFPRWATVYGIFSYFAKRSSQIPPLNLAYIAAVSEEKGHTVELIDCQAEELSEEDLLEKILTFKPDLIGTTSTTPLFDIACKYASFLKKYLRDIPIVIGGNHATILREKDFPICFDYGFVGEAEESFPIFLEYLESGKDVSEVKGIIYRNIDGQAVFTGFAPPIMDIDSIPQPATHLLKMDLYLYGTMKGRKKCATVMASRGCPFDCIFCATEVFGKKVRRRKPELVVEEMKLSIDRFGAEHFYFLDDTLTLDKKYILDICDKIISAKLNITFEGGTRANCVDEEIISSLAKAGCVRISFGLEAVDENIRRIMRKNVPLDDYINANKLTNKYNIETLNSCMIGLPGESLETIRDLLRFLRFSKDIKQANLAIAVPYPGTALYKMALTGQYGLKLLTEDFSKYRRYGSAVMDVGDLKAGDLVKLQNDAFVSIYMAPWRYMPVFRKQGLIGVLLTFMRFLKSFCRVIVNKDGLFWFDKE